MNCIHPIYFMCKNFNVPYSSIYCSRSKMSLVFESFLDQTNTLCETNSFTQNECMLSCIITVLRRRAHNSMLLERLK